MREIPLPSGVSIDSLAWRLCHATCDYEVSEYGHVRRRTPGRKTYPGKILSFCWHRAGYPRFKLTIDGKELIEIDTVNMVEIVNGVDRLAEHRTALGL